MVKSFGSDSSRVAATFVGAGKTTAALAESIANGVTAIVTTIPIVVIARRVAVRMQAPLVIERDLQRDDGDSGLDQLPFFM